MLKSFIGRPYYNADGGAANGGGGAGSAQQQGGDGGQQGQGQENQGQENQGGDELTWDAFFNELDDVRKDLIASHTRGLKSALDAERERAKRFERELKKLSGQAAEGSDLRASLDKLQADLAAANLRASFYASAIPNEVEADAIELAFLAAERGGFIGRDGDIDWKGLKAAHPRLFRQAPATPTVRANAGAGVGQRQEQAESTDAKMNRALRQAFGRRG